MTDHDAEDFNSPEDYYASLDDAQPTPLKVLAFPAARQHADALEKTVAAVHDAVRDADTVAQVYPIFLWLRAIEKQITGLTTLAGERLIHLEREAK